MGQYYHPVSIDKMECVYSHDYGSSLNLMEHSWSKNDFVGVVARLIAKGGRWFGDKIVWAGDYADPEEGTEENFYHMAGEHKIEPDVIKGKKRLRYVVNLDTKQFVDINNVPSNDGWVIHPLPLLTCEGNGRGGGDFRGDDPNKLIGKWARNRVTMQTTEPKGYKELVFNLFK
jgi:hypothetical protein